jgi:hypothetical protein
MTAKCSDCGHEWDEPGCSYAAGDIDYRSPKMYRCYICPKCSEQLYVPRLIDKNSWDHWLAGNLVVVKRSSLLAIACQRISAILCGRRTRYTPTELDIGPLECIHCKSPMEICCSDDFSIECPHCGRRSARSHGVCEFFDPNIRFEPETPA